MMASLSHSGHSEVTAGQNDASTIIDSGLFAQPHDGSACSSDDIWKGVDDLLAATSVPTASSITPTSTGVQSPDLYATFRDLFNREPRAMIGEAYQTSLHTSLRQLAEAGALESTTTMVKQMMPAFRSALDRYLGISSRLKAGRRLPAQIQIVRGELEEKYKKKQERCLRR